MKILHIPTGTYCKCFKLDNTLFIFDAKVLTAVLHGAKLSSIDWISITKEEWIRLTELTLLQNNPLQINFVTHYDGILNTGISYFYSSLLEFTLIDED